MIHAADLHAAIRRNFKDLAYLDAVRHHNFYAAAGEHGALATNAFERSGKCRLRANGFQFEELAIGAALLDKIADRGDFPVAKDEHFIAGFFHVAEKVRGKQ